MNKYIITEDIKQALLRTAEKHQYADMTHVIESLTPIEPLSDEQIMEIVSNKPFNSAIGFAHTIERHIRGETP